MQRPQKKQKTKHICASRHYDMSKAKQLLTKLIPDVQDICDSTIYYPECKAYGIAQLRHILHIFQCLDDSDLIETFDGYEINRPDVDTIEGISGMSVLHVIAKHLCVSYKHYSCISTGKRVRETSDNIKKALMQYYESQKTIRERLHTVSLSHSL